MFLGSFKYFGSDPPVWVLLLNLVLSVINSPLTSPMGLIQMPTHGPTPQPSSPSPGRCRMPGAGSVPGCPLACPTSLRQWDGSSLRRPALPPQQSPPFPAPSCPQPPGCPCSVFLIMHKSKTNSSSSNLHTKHCQLS